MSATHDALRCPGPLVAILNARWTLAGEAKRPGIMDREFSTTFSRPLIRTAEISNVGCLHLHLCKYCPNDIGDPVQIATEPASSVSVRRAHLARGTCEDLRGALGRSGVGEGRLCHFESVSRLDSAPPTQGRGYMASTCRWRACPIEPFASQSLTRTHAVAFPAAPTVDARGISSSRPWDGGRGCGWRGGGCKTAMQIRTTPLLHKCNFDRELHRHQKLPLFSFAAPFVGFDA